MTQQHKGEEIRITAKNRKDKVGAFLLEKEVKMWLEKNKDMMKDYKELAGSVIHFRMMWGIPVDLVIGEVEENKGRGLSLTNQLK